MLKFTCLNCSSKLQFCWEENSEEGVEWADPCPPRSPPGGVPPPDKEDLFVFVRLKLLSERDIGPDPGNCGIKGGKGGRRLGGIPLTPPSFPRKWDNGDVRYSRLNASSPARPRGGGSFDAATANAAAASEEAMKIMSELYWPWPFRCIVKNIHMIRYIISNSHAYLLRIHLLYFQCRYCFLRIHHHLRYP